ncbi:MULTISPECIES: DUF6759 domain-containing protein [Chryseobacterium]|uniref:DUF6759 domain-containing protein n=1 Tax=Chryseobacterium TaxID=59732 RepID=UPI001553047A|nr:MULTISPECIES: DUF6759 domain-containing protein [unclassified Chryseobacterium]MDC8105612.1 competence protein ComL [Chryseobacterium sp. B21-037]MDQ1806363.1 competence protein ComL [Chryseobacterium sp. CKR4-1]WBV54831.1 competence protein ComL [Chryseobacterium daecheongense]
MKKKLLLPGIILSLIMISCSVNYNNYPIRRNPFPSTSATSSRVSTEREYNELMKTYKPETTEVLNDLLNDSSGSTQTSFSVENKSPCNMVLTISGNNYYRKIPIGANKIGYVMLPKNQSYKLSGMVCNSVYQSTKFITNSYSITLSN